MPAAAIRRLILEDFRSYRRAQLAPTRHLVVLTGPNGAGKTNLIEAISFLAPGRGLRRATAAEVARSSGSGGWAVSVEIEGLSGFATLGTGRIADDAGDGRVCRIDRETVASAGAFSDHLRIVWLTPAMDSLFTGPAAERRRFLDRVVLTVDPLHGSRVNALERALRARNRLLENAHPDPAWLDAVEHELSDVAVAVAAARLETVQRLQATLSARRTLAFPSAELTIAGALENALAGQSAGAVEEGYRRVLRDERARDAAAGRTLEGPHRADLAVTFPGKNLPAASASTGEQKALLIGIVLAQAALVEAMVGAAPVILLDEVVAHLDPARRQSLYEGLSLLKAQVWMTGADPAAFADVPDQPDWIDVLAGEATQR